MSSGVVEVERAQKRWAGGELLLYAAMQLALVSVAYKIDRRRKVPLVATSSWAILLGLAVRIVDYLSIYATSRLMLLGWC